MKNNQFKKVIANEIKNQAKTKNYKVICVDISNNNRMIYIYGLDYTYKGVIDLWLNDDYVHITLLKEHRYRYNPEVKANYCNFQQVINFIINVFTVLIHFND